MKIHIKNERRDHPTEGAIGFSCGRYITRKLQLHGVHGTKLGNPHNIDICRKCGKGHDREDAITACLMDREWQDELDKWLIEWTPKLRHRKHVDLWCWCAPESCHCDLIKQALELFVKRAR